MAATNRIKCYARAIHDGGIECEVVVCGSTELKKKGIRNTMAKGVYEGVSFRYIGNSTVGSSVSIVRKLMQFYTLLKTKWFIRQNLQKGDVLFFFMVAKMGWVLRFMKAAKRKNAYCVRDLCELPLVTRAETENAIRLRKATIEKQFPKLDGIISISNALFNLAKTYTPSTCKHIKVPIMVEYEHYVVNNRSTQEPMPYIFHAGSLTQQKDGILGMIEAFGIAKQKLSMPVKYVLTGKIEQSSHPVELKSIINKYHLEDSIEFVGFLMRNQVKEYLSHASLVISNRPKSKQDYYGFSTKVGEYLASATPLITTKWGEAVNWLKDGESAYIIEPENTEALADTIIHVFDNPDKALRIGLNGQEVCHRCFDYRSWSQPLVDFLKHLGD